MRADQNTPRVNYANARQMASEVLGLANPNCPGNKNSLRHADQQSNHDL